MVRRRHRPVPADGGEPRPALPWRGGAGAEAARAAAAGNCADAGAGDSRLGRPNTRSYQPDIEELLELGAVPLAVDVSARRPRRLRVAPGLGRESGARVDGRVSRPRPDAACRHEEARRGARPAPPRRSDLLLPRRGEARHLVHQRDPLLRRRAHAAARHPRQLGSRRGWIQHRHQGQSADGEAQRDRRGAARRPHPPGGALVLAPGRQDRRRRRAAQVRRGPAWRLALVVRALARAAATRTTPRCWRRCARRWS